MAEYEIVRNPVGDVWRTIVDLTYKDEGWLLSYEDYAMWLQAFGDAGFILFAAISKETKDVFGSVCLAIYGANLEHPDVMTVGVFYVRPDRRGMGIGTRLFGAVMDEAKKHGGNVTLNGVLRMSPKYASRYGFNKFNSWHPTPVTVAVQYLRPSLVEKDSKIKIVSSSDVSFDELLLYDKNIIGIAREGYLSALLQQKHSIHKIAINSEQIVGFINARNVAGSYLCIGPFYADNNVIACSLLRALFDSTDNLHGYGGLMLCIPTLNKSALHIIDKISEGHLIKHDYMASQFTDHVVPTKVENIFATTEYAMSYA